jgi:hypothetical protein
LSSYPKQKVVPLFPVEPSGHAMMDYEPAFFTAFPELEAELQKTWGGSL